MVRLKPAEDVNAGKGNPPEGPKSLRWRPRRLKPRLWLCRSLVGRAPGGGGKAHRGRRVGDCWSDTAVLHLSRGGEVRVCSGHHRVGDAGKTSAT